MDYFLYFGIGSILISVVLPIYLFATSGERRNWETRIKRTTKILSDIQDSREKQWWKTGKEHEICDCGPSPVLTNGILSIIKCPDCSAFVQIPSEPEHLKQLAMKNL